jgi:hypothetical protein
MTRMTWSKFFWDDVLRDHNLQRCTFTARGFWLHLKALSVQAEPMGYLAEGDVPMTTSDIARLSQLDKRSVERLLRELEAAGVFSRDARGTIYCRRIVRENAARLRNKINGSAGGNPQLTAKSSERPDNPYKLKANQQSANEPPQDEAAPPASPVAPIIRAAEAMGTTLEALHRKTSWGVFGDTFATWLEEGCDAERDIWPTLARLVAKRRKIPASPAYFTEAVREARDKRRDGAAPSAHTIGAPYLASSALVAPAFVTAEQWADRVRMFHTHGLWSRRWGPKPGEADVRHQMSDVREQMSAPLSDTRHLTSDIRHLTSEI